MMTLENILKEIKSLPGNRLEEVFQFVKSLIQTKDNSMVSKGQEILSFSGIFSGMSELDYKEYTEELESLRGSLFDRKIDL